MKSISLRTRLLVIAILTAWPGAIRNFGREARPFRVVSLLKVAHSPAALIPRAPADTTADPVAMHRVNLAGPGVPYRLPISRGHVGLFTRAAATAIPLLFARPGLMGQSQAALGAGRSRSMHVEPAG